MNTEIQPLIFHHRGKLADVTIVARKTDDILCYSASRCSAKDQFSKKIGIKIATGRLDSNQIIATRSVENDLIKQFKKDAVDLGQYVEKNPNYREVMFSSIENFEDEQSFESIGEE